MNHDLRSQVNCQEQWNKSGCNPESFAVLPPILALLVGRLPSKQGPENAFLRQRAGHLTRIPKLYETKNSGTTYSAPLPYHLTNLGVLLPTFNIALSPILQMFRGVAKQDWVLLGPFVLAVELCWGNPSSSFPFQNTDLARIQVAPIVLSSRCRLWNSVYLRLNLNRIVKSRVGTPSLRSFTDVQQAAYHHPPLSLLSSIEMKFEVEDVVV